MKYYSVIGFGKAYFVQDIEEKRVFLDIIMKKYAGQDKFFDYSNKTLEKTELLKVEITHITGKKSGY